MKAESKDSEKEPVLSFDVSRPLPAEKLLTQQRAVQIAFKGQIYTLRQTRNDKLILTK